MKGRPPLLWILAIGFLLLAAPLLILWWMTARPAPLPIERFMPRRLAAALCLRHAREAWQRHWQARPGPAPEDALKAVFEAIDEWPRWVKKYGEIQSRVRLKLYEEAFFQAVGEEAWFLIGEWGEDPPHPGGKPARPAQTGLVVFLRGDTAMRSRITPLMDLILGDYKIKRSRCEGETVYEYSSKKLTRSMTFCQIGGWICISLRRRDSGPLPEIIHQVRRAGAPSSALTRDLNLDPEARLNAAILCGISPPILWDQLHRLKEQQRKTFSPAGLARIQYWQKEFAGIDRLSLRQWGDSILDLELAAEGPRLAELSRQLQSEGALNRPFTAEPAATDLPVKADSGPPNAAANELAQLEMELPLARLSAPLSGFSWPEVLENAEAVDLVLPGLRDRLAASLVKDASRQPGRIGLAAWPSPAVIVPYLHFWVDRASTSAVRTAPAQTRLSAAAPPPAQAPAASFCQWIGLPPAGAPPSARAFAGMDWKAFVNRVWVQTGRTPLVFLTLNFRGLADQLDKVPTLLMKKKQRKKLDRWKSTLGTLALGTGGAAIRLDADGPLWRLTCRTP